MSRLFCMVVAVVGLAVAGLAQERVVVENVSTNLVLYFGASSTNRPGYDAATWRFTEVPAGRITEVALLYSSVVIGEVQFSVVKSGVDIPRYAVAMSNIAHVVWEPLALNVQRGDQLKIVPPEYGVTNTVVIEVKPK